MPSAELDHIFICVAAGAPEIEHLIAWGLREGASNTHPGQGTANRRIFFENAMLELLWVAHPAEARSEQTAPTKLWERWIGRGSVASPFGFVLRPASGNDLVPPFAAWAYQPNYMPAGVSLHISEAAIDEPMWVFMPFVRGSSLETPPHPNGVREITGLTLTSPTPLRSGAAQALPMLHIESGPEHLLTIEFDQGIRNESIDLRPNLPLILRR